MNRKDLELFFKSTLETICRKTYQDLLTYLNELICKYGYTPDLYSCKDNSYLFASNKDCKLPIPICVVAHLDTVHKDLCKKIIYSCKDKSILSSPQGIGGDDRCGVAMILALLKIGFRPHILFTCGEEIGGHGANAFCEAHKELPCDINFFLEIDRRGSTDVVRYSDSNIELTEAFEKYGFKRSFGSFTDISFLCPHFGVSGVNVSSGYYLAHTKVEYIDLKDLVSIFIKLYKLLQDKEVVSKKYVYKKESFVYDKSLFSYHNKYKSFRHDDFEDITGHVVKHKQSHCITCGRVGYKDNKDLLDSDFGPLCPECANALIVSHKAVKCHCGHIIDVKDKNNYIFDDYKGVLIMCPYCGEVIDM